MPKKSCSQWAKESGVEVRTAQRWRKKAGVGTITPAGYMLTLSEWQEVMSLMETGKGGK